MNKETQKKAIKFIKAVSSHPISSSFNENPDDPSDYYTFNAIRTRIENNHYIKISDILNEMEQKISIMEQYQGFYEIASNEIRKIIEKQKKKYFLSNVEWGRMMGELRNKLCGAFSKQTDKIKKFSHIKPIEQKPQIYFLDSNDYINLEKELADCTENEVHDLTKIILDNQPDIKIENGLLNVAYLSPPTVIQVKEYLIRKRQY